MNHEEMTLPSGRTIEHNGLNLVRSLHSGGFVKWSEEPVELNSKISSRVYVLGRQDLTDHQEVLIPVGQRVSAVSKELAIAEGVDVYSRQVCLLGIPVAGTKFAQAALHHSYPPVCFRTVREVKKRHGEHHHYVEGRPDQKRHYYMTIDNALTSGKALLLWLRRLERDGYPTKDMIHLVFVDRQQGGVERLRRRGYRVEPIFYLLDLVHIFCELGFWPKERYQQIEEELRQNQFSQ